MGYARSASTVGPGDERQVGQRRAGLGLEPVLELLPHLLDVVEVDLHRGPHGRRERPATPSCPPRPPGACGRAPRPGRAGRRPPAAATRPRARPGPARPREPPGPRQPPERGAAAAGPAPGPAAGDRALHVLAPDPAARPGAGDRGDVEPGLGDEAAHQRREHPAVAVGGRGRARRRRGGRAAAGAAAPPLAGGWPLGAGAARRAGLADAGQHGADGDGLALRRRGSRASRRRTGWGSPSRPCRWTPRTAGRRTPPCRRPA